MGRTSATDGIVGRFRLCVELCSFASETGVHWTIIASLPGRETAYKRRWHGSSGRLNESQLEDMQAFVGQLVDNAVTMIDGSQQSLGGVR